jgi:hypothetical protein
MAPGDKVIVDQWQRLMPPLRQFRAAQGNEERQRRSLMRLGCHIMVEGASLMIF